MKRKVKIIIESKNIERIIAWIVKNNLEYYYLKKINRNSIIIILEEKKVELIRKYSPTIKINYVSSLGIYKISEHIKKNQITYMFLIIFLVVLFFLSNIIFSINVYSNNLSIKEYVENELVNYGIKKYVLKKDRKELSRISELFVHDHQNEFEWLEISNIGTKYIIKFVERQENVKDNTNLFQSIVSKKDAIISKIVAESGEIVRTKNEYVKKDDLIITGEILKPDGEIIKKNARGKVYGDVWYKVNVKIPIYQIKKKYTDKEKHNIIFKIVSNNKELINHKFKNYDNIEIFNLENNIIPISINFVKQREYLKKYETNFIDYESISAKKRINDYFKENNKEYIQTNKFIELDKVYENNYINYTYFVSVTEDITKIIDISGLNY